jgi:hypothetical protein
MKMNWQMFRKRACGFRWVAGLMLTPLLAAQADPQKQADALIGYEAVGQVLNAGTQSLQYGYLNFVRDLPEIATAPAISEATALLTFYNDTTTVQVINNGPIRTIDRTGIGTIYFDDTSTGYFTTTFEMEVTSATPFTISGHTYQIGKPGDVYRVSVSGKLATAGPPTAYIAGMATGLGADVVEKGK